MSVRGKSQGVAGRCTYTPCSRYHERVRLRRAEVDLAAVDGLEVWAYTPLLSGAYDNPAKQIPEVFDHPGSTQRLAVLDDVAAQVGASRGQVVLAWLAA